MKGAIFDMDGTLLDSMEAWDRIIPLFLKEQGIKNAENVNEEIAPLTFEDGSQYMVEHFSLPMNCQEVMKEINRMMLWEYTHAVRMKRGVKSYLAKLKKEGIPMCVATATDRELVIPALKKHGILDFFDYILTVEEVGVGKEHPDIFLQCAEYLGLEPEECCVFEDSLHGIRAAASAGFEVCAVEDKGSAAVNEVEIKRLSNHYIKSFEELL